MFVRVVVAERAVFRVKFIPLTPAFALNQRRALGLFSVSVRQSPWFMVSWEGPGPFWNSSWRFRGSSGGPWSWGMASAAWQSWQPGLDVYNSGILLILTWHGQTGDVSGIPVRGDKATFLGCMCKMYDTRGTVSLNCQKAFFCNQDQETMRIFEINTISKLPQIPWHNFVCDLAFLPGIDNAVEELGEWLRKVYPARSNTWSCSIDMSRTTWTTFQVDQSWQTCIIWTIGTCAL